MELMSIKLYILLQCWQDVITVKCAKLLYMYTMCLHRHGLYTVLKSIISWILTAILYQQYMY